MSSNRRRQVSALVALLLAAATATGELKPERIGVVETLPAKYPDHWAIVHDVSFFHMLEGEVLIVDPLAASGPQQYKGMITASFIAGYRFGKARNEHYVAETFFSRGGRGGERTDVITIWDAQTLAVSAEIEIPSKRVSGMPKKIAIGLSADERLMYIYNFTPAQSVSVVNLETREFVGEIDTPGCGFAIPTGRYGFTSICSNGSLRTTVLDEAGRPANSDQSEPLFDVDEDPIFEGAAMANGIAHFPTFAGRVLPVNIADDIAEGSDNWWWLTGPEERNWRPGGLVPIASDQEGTGYFLMNPQGGEGTHKDGGAHVWTYDLDKGERTRQIELKTWGLAIGVTGTGDDRLLIVCNAEMQLDVYRAVTGEYVHTLAIEPQTPFQLYNTH